MTVLGRAHRRAPDALAPRGARAQQLETELTWARWVAIAIAGSLLFGFDHAVGTDQPLPGHVRPIGSLFIGLLIGVNVGLFVALRRPLRTETLRRLGVGIFGIDAIVVYGLSLLYTFPQNADTWAIPFVLVLEGALRFGISGSLVPVGLSILAETAREVYRADAAATSFDPEFVAFRVGMLLLVAIVAGLMADRLARERELAVERHRELDVFHRIVLGGAGGRTVEETVSRIVEQMATGLGYESFAIGLTEQTDMGTIVRLVGAKGFPPDSVGAFVRAGEGIAGRTVLTGRSQLIEDTQADPDYVEFIPHARSEMCTPIFAGDRVIGAIDVESSVPKAFAPADLVRLELLAPQIGLIIENARLLEQERTTADRLRELDAMRSEFVAVASHELRTPLTAIGGTIKTLLRRDAHLSTDERVEFYRAVDRRSDRLIRLVEDLLLVTQLDRRVLELAPRPVNVHAMLAGVLADVGDEAARVRIALDEDVWIEVDEERLGQILRNLVENALKFSTQAVPVKLAVSHDSGSILFEVTDHGPGIAASEQKRIFEPFHQIGGAMQRSASGVGLGLHIARSLTEALGGEIGVRSVPGDGATFSVRLSVPVVVEAQATMSSPAMP